MSCVPPDAGEKLRYVLHCVDPALLGRVDVGEVVRAHGGAAEQLFAAISHRYRTALPTLYDAVHAFYGRHRPRNPQKVASVLAAWKGAEHQLPDALALKYHTDFFSAHYPGLAEALAEEHRHNNNPDDYDNPNNRNNNHSNNYSNHNYNNPNNHNNHPDDYDNSNNHNIHDDNPDNYNDHGYNGNPGAYVYPSTPPRPVHGLEPLEGRMPPHVKAAVVRFFERGAPEKLPEVLALITEHDGRGGDRLLTALRACWDGSAGGGAAAAAGGWYDEAAGRALLASVEHFGRPPSPRSRHGNHPPWSPGGDPPRGHACVPPIWQRRLPPPHVVSDRDTGLPPPEAAEAAQLRAALRGVQRALDGLPPHVLAPASFPGGGGGGDGQFPAFLLSPTPPPLPGELSAGFPDPPPPPALPWEGEGVPAGGLVRVSAPVYAGQGFGRQATPPELGLRKSVRPLGPGGRDPFREAGVGPPDSPGPSSSTKSHPFTVRSHPFSSRSKQPPASAVDDHPLPTSRRATDADPSAAGTGGRPADSAELSSRPPALTSRALRQLLGPKAEMDDQQGRRCGEGSTFPGAALRVGASRGSSSKPASDAASKPEAYRSEAFGGGGTSEARRPPPEAAASRASKPETRQLHSEGSNDGSGVEAAETQGTLRGSSKPEARFSLGRQPRSKAPPSGSSDGAEAAEAQRTLPRRGGDSSKPEARSSLDRQPRSKAPPSGSSSGAEAAEAQRTLPRRGGDSSKPEARSSLDRQPGSKAPPSSSSDGAEAAEAQRTLPRRRGRSEPPRADASSEPAASQLPLHCDPPAGDEGRREIPSPPPSRSGAASSKPETRPSPESHSPPEPPTRGGSGNPEAVEAERILALLRGPLRPATEPTERGSSPPWRDEGGASSPWPRTHSPEAQQPPAGGCAVPRHLRRISPARLPARALASTSPSVAAFTAAGPRDLSPLGSTASHPFKRAASRKASEPPSQPRPVHQASRSSGNVMLV
ncbi:hypothetical protein DIPPA_28858 [Diplonema papillatum]|nr:hypothetical protein DIPPA_28858 [Diplonema papillatum]KAJ9457128.1 hypothetical protein DIPPA_28858 [Diplonema papillatum]